MTDTEAKTFTALYSADWAGRTTEARKIALSCLRPTPARSRQLRRLAAEVMTRLEGGE